FLRLVPAESHRVFALTLLVGALCGGAAVLFHLAIIAVESRVIDRAMAAPTPHWMWLTVLTPTAGGLLSGALLYFIVPGARGSGIPQVKVAYAVKGGRVPFVDAAGKFLIGVLQIGTGSSLGARGQRYRFVRAWRAVLDERLRCRVRTCDACFQSASRPGLQLLSTRQ